MLTRRDAVLISLAGCATPWSLVRPAVPAGFDGERYAKAIVIDSLGGPGGFDPDVPDDGPLDARSIAAVRGSGAALRWGLLSTVPRADVAAFMVDALERPETIGGALTLIA